MEGYDIYNIDYHYRIDFSYWTPEFGPDGARKFEDAFPQFEVRVKKVMEENHSKQQVIEEKIIKQQNMKDHNSTKIVIDSKCNASQLLPAICLCML